MQIALIPIAGRHAAHAQEIADKLRAAGFRAEVDARNEKMGKRIRENEMQKVPIMLIVGDKDIENGTVSVRKRGEGDVGAKTLDEALAYLQQLREPENHRSDGTNGPEYN